MDRTHIRVTLYYPPPHAHISPGIGSWFWDGRGSGETNTPLQHPPHGSWLY